MRTYLEIKVPIKYDDPWFKELRSLFADIPVRWQKDYYHITMAFVNNTPKSIDMCQILKSHLTNVVAPELTFDLLDVFSTSSGYIFHLSASRVPEAFLTLTESIRADMIAAGCLIQSNFMLHVTLGRLRDFNIRLPKLKRMIKTIPLSPFTLTLADVDYREFRGSSIYETQLPRNKAR
ncbi:MAG: hypothetical protein J5548_10285 [Prevotella sp.]|nr:hypothetical protein [Prevotella sp.]